MGICENNRAEGKLPVSPDWYHHTSCIHAQLTLLQNKHHREHHVFMFENPSLSRKQPYEQREKNNHPDTMSFLEWGQGDTTFYVITEEVVRLKELKVNYLEAVAIAYYALRGFQHLMQLYGGFIPQDDMVFLTRAGNVKVWINDNIAVNEPSYPHPRISEAEFIQSFINQMNSHIYYTQENIISAKGPNQLLPTYPSFYSALKALKNILNTYKYNSRGRIRFENRIFQNYVLTYRSLGGNIDAQISKRWRTSRADSARGDIKYMVDDKKGKDGFVRKYALEKGENPFSKQIPSAIQTKSEQIGKIHSRSMSQRVPSSPESPVRQTPKNEGYAHLNSKNLANLIEVESQLIILNKIQLKAEN